MKRWLWTIALLVMSFVELVNADIAYPNQRFKSPLANTPMFPWWLYLGCGLWLLFVAFKFWWRDWR